MTTIVITNLKGGASKTTLAINLAAYYYKNDKRVLLIDSDPQGSVSDWAHNRPDNFDSFTTISIATNRINKEIETLKESFDIIIIDTAPRINGILRSALLTADITLIPIIPSGVDVWATIETLEIINEVKIQNVNMISMGVISRYQENTKVYTSLLNALKDMDISCCKSKIKSRTCYPLTIGDGSNVIDKPINKQAVDEIQSLGEEILQLIKEEENV